MEEEKRKRRKEVKAMDKLNAGVIGCGLISKNHLMALKNVAAADCVAVCDVERPKAQKAADEYSIPKVYTDYHEMLKCPDIQAVHICTPHHLHAQMAIDALGAGKHVLCEKPMAINADDARKMIEARDKSGRQLAICFQNRYNQASIYMKNLLTSGELGRVQGARGSVAWDRKPEYYASSPWRGRWDTAGGGVLINQAIHTFDLLQWLTCPIASVEARMATARLKGSIEVEDTIDVVMTGQEGQRILFYASNCYVKNAPVEIEIICERGSVKMTGNQVVTNLNGEVAIHDHSSGTVFGKDYWGSGHGFLIDDFYRCIRDGLKFPVSGEEALVSVILLEAVYRSAKEEVPVSIGGSDKA